MTSYKGTLERSNEGVLWSPPHDGPNYQTLTPSVPHDSPDQAPSKADVTALIEQILYARYIHQALGLPVNATIEQGLRTYKRLVRTIHPDKCATEDLRVTTAFERLRDAYFAMKEEGINVKEAGFSRCCITCTSPYSYTTRWYNTRSRCILQL